jgi:hypothetical protein
MATAVRGLKIGDIILIRYHSPCWLDEQKASGERWIRAEVIHTELGAWPLARLSDGQYTEVRPFMRWRHAGRSTGAFDERQAA